MAKLCAFEECDDLQSYKILVVEATFLLNCFEVFFTKNCLYQVKRFQESLNQRNELGMKGESIPQAMASIDFGECVSGYLGL